MMAIEVKGIPLPAGIESNAAGTQGNEAAGAPDDAARATKLGAATGTSTGTSRVLALGIEEPGAGTEGRARPGPWIYKPTIDLAIGCAGWSAPLLLLLYFTQDNGVIFSIVFYGLALLFNFPHYTATIYRAYRTREDFSRYRIFTVHVTLLMLLAGAIAHWAGWLIPVLFTIYVTWSPWHYSGQNFGLAMMFARRAGVNPARAERNALYISFLASYALVFLTMHSGVSTDPYLRSLGLSAGPADPLRAVLAVVFSLTAPWALYRLGRRGGWRLIIAPATLFSTQFLWFVLPFVLQLAYKIDIPQTRYSTGILAVMHSAQYLWITSYYARREAVASGVEGWRPVPYFASMILGGVALFLPGPWLISYVFHYDFTSSMLIFIALVNIHHFVLDGAIWKLREGRIAGILVSSPGRVRSSLWGVAAWIASGGRTARTFRIAAATLLVLIAILDQARFFLAVDANDVARLSLAERLNPYDEAVHARLAISSEASGETDRSLEEYQRALQLNPRDAAARTGVVRLLVQGERYQEAYDQYKLMVPYIAGDSNSLLNFGVLADRLGHRDEAIESWNRTIGLDPDAKNAYLYLADALYADGRQLDAIPHYEKYLALLTTTRDARPDPQEVVRVALRVGDAYTASREFDRALIFYHKAADIAKQTGIKVLESLTLEHAGNLYAAGGQRRQAADLYRRALRLDAEGQDDNAAGLDWFAYAQFLDDAGQPKLLALACTLRAESLLSRSAVEQLDEVKRYRESLESSLGDEAVDKARRDRDSLVDQSLDVKF
jgi:tetratricopeptide (TPR) repeat protein